MTAMTDIEISKALSLAIGWDDRDVLIYKGALMLRGTGKANWYWREFDYRDWNVIGPIADKQKAGLNWVESSHRAINGCWAATCDGRICYADTPQKAIALAVIGAAK